MKKLFLSVALMALTTLLLAQQGYEDVVYLKNGSILHGVIVEQVPNQSIKIQTADRNVFVFKMAEIERLTKEVVQTKQTSKQIVEVPSGLEKGYQFILEPGVGVGVNKAVDVVKIDIVNGIRFNPYFALGIGTGIRRYNDVLALPLYLDLRVNLIKRRVSPYFSLGAGYAFTIDETELGAFVQPAVGVSFRVGNATAMHVGLCLNAQSLTNEYSYYSGYYYGSVYTPYTSYRSVETIYYSLGFNVGFSF